MKLLDTDVLIEIIKKNKIEELREACISIITLLEYLRGIKDEEEREIVKENIEKIVQIVNLENKSILIYSKMYEKLKARGILISDADLLQASIAIANNFTFVTRNTKHFKRLEDFGLKILQYQ
jgi:predicted nucleic acid-binding protein